MDRGLRHFIPTGDHALPSLPSLPATIETAAPTVTMSNDKPVTADSTCQKEDEEAESKTSMGELNFIADDRGEVQFPAQLLEGLRVRL